MAEPTTVVAFDQEQPARLLVDYLNSKRIHAVYVASSEPHRHGVALFDSAQIDEAKPLIEGFITNPYHQKYQSAAWKHGTQFTGNGETAFNINGMKAPFRGAPVVTAIFALCSLIFALYSIGFAMPVRYYLFIQPFPILLDTQQWWRTITPALVHLSALHFVFNMGWWVYLGSQVERKLGSVFLFALFGVSAISSNISQLMVSGPYFGGLSGVVYALMGFVWWIGWLKPNWNMQLSKPLVGFMLLWLILGYADVLWVNMANTAHLIGLISGCALAWLVSKISDLNAPNNT
ncbi:rhomboid family intramembrane serine protease GlpG [Aestuariibacter sp. AA17]|uniref:Rhomboid family intramembrane serine protease GlpG n=1 Tax=Fluctibacter corallii TaxID=2984329 RepID=A0ABT3AC53_9ALTE|nr:rhomboid family intramembrane serine protease GlpG [Aestuariibacter sp. AA17]MCV2886172.1 rhomboid family intramembrane serine protease GlpG [Aestuariibacter sp. AA17]